MPLIRPVDLDRYRAAVGDLLDELGIDTGLDGGAGLGGGTELTASTGPDGGVEPGDLARVEAILNRRVGEAEFDAVLAGTPGGTEGAVDRVLREVRRYRPNARSSAADLTALIRIAMLTQIDVLWWGGVPAYRRDADLLGSAELVDLGSLRRRGELRFRYRRQPGSLPARAVRAAGRRLGPNRTPRTAGLRFTRARPEVVVLLNGLADEFARRAPAGTPPLWITSITRSVEHQHRLRALGYAALLPSAHCVGYGIDLEMSWFQRFGADHVLRAVLIERQAAGEINVIGEGQAWHVCLAPPNEAVPPSETAPRGEAAPPNETVPPDGTANRNIPPDAPARPNRSAQDRDAPDRGAQDRDAPWDRPTLPGADRWNG